MRFNQFLFLSCLLLLFVQVERNCFPHLVRIIWIEDIIPSFVSECPPSTTGKWTKWFQINKVSKEVDFESIVDPSVCISVVGV